ncbi:MAG: TonB-dependent receptor [Cyclobacteriaceae bacterium]|nr:TonB-dependent receptor [Cyclobacteriaceae bacterium]
MGLEYRILIVSLFLIRFSASAQQALTGTISDADDHTAIPGATVYFPDLKKGTVSQLDGTYYIDQLPMGKFLVEFKFVGYAPEVRTVEIKGVTKFDIELSAKATELNEVVITGISQSTELRSNPIPIVTMSAQSLVSNTASNLIDNISKIAGISQITTGAAISKPVIRGLSYNRIITLYDGIRQEGQQWGDEHGIEIDEFSAERVEIIKGAGSLMYGSDGIGGVINFLAPDPVAQGTINGKWISNYQSNNGLIANSVHSAGNIKGIYWLVRGSNKNARPYSNKYDGRVFNSGFNETDISGYVGINRSWGYSQLSVSSFSQSVGIVEGERDQGGNFVYLKDNNGNPEETIASAADLKSYHLFIPRQSINHKRLASTNNLHLGLSRVQINMSYQNNKRKEFGNVLNEGEKSLFFDLTTVNYNVNLFLPEKSDRQISIGTSGMKQANRNKGKEFLIPEYRSFDWGIYGFVKQNINTLDLSGGIRFDQRQIHTDALYLDEEGNPVAEGSGVQKFQESAMSFTNFTGSLGVSQRFTRQLTAKVNLSKGFRAPNLAELASNGNHEGSFRYEYGNRNLKAETSYQLDAGILFHADHISTEVSLFYNDIDHYIYVEKLLASDGGDSIPNPAEPALAYQYVQGHATLSGGEFLLDLHPHPFDWLHFENSFSFVRAVNKSGSATDSSKYLPFTPAPRYQSEIRANIMNVGKYLSNVFVKLEYNYYWSQDQVFLENGTETVTPSYSIWNAGLGTNVISKKGQTLFSFYFTITNLFDKAYQNHLNRLKYGPDNPLTGRTGVFNMGRNVSFKIVVPFTFRSPK